MPHVMNIPVFNEARDNKLRDTLVRFLDGILVKAVKDCKKAKCNFDEIMSLLEKALEHENPLPKTHELYNKAKAKGTW
eukprot:m.71081 g.71081  ORF g.71081 m.71081 type:complete len:78 (+) comp7916_c0_seq1:626-859(+)